MLQSPQCHYLRAKLLTPNAQQNELIRYLGFFSPSCDGPFAWVTPHYGRDEIVLDFFLSPDIPLHRFNSEFLQKTLTDIAGFHIGHPKVVYGCYMGDFHRCQCPITHGYDTTRQLLLAFIYAMRDMAISDLLTEPC